MDEQLLKMADENIRKIQESFNELREHREAIVSSINVLKAKVEEIDILLKNDPTLHTGKDEDNKVSHLINEDKVGVETVEEKAVEESTKDSVEDKDEEVSKKSSSRKRRASEKKSEEVVVEPESSVDESTVEESEVVEVEDSLNDVDSPEVEDDSGEILLIEDSESEKNLFDSIDDPNSLPF